MKLQDKVAVITGGNSGIGLATAREFRANGAKVVILGRSRQTLDQAAASLGSDVLAVQGDVRNLGDLERLFKQAAEGFVKIDVLVANAEGPDRQIHAVLPLGVVFTAIRQAGKGFVQDERAYFKPMPPPGSPHLIITEEKGTEVTL